MNESGNHCFHRNPPTEKRGRVHTSIVSVSVVEEGNFIFDELNVPDDEFKIQWFSGTGKGGQHRNKKQCSCRVIHIPTGLKESRQGREREKNLNDAKEAIISKLREMYEEKIADKHADIKLKQIGYGVRGDRMRTYKIDQDLVKDHRSGKRTSFKNISRGKFDKLWM
jgi:peptide chain release factor 1